MTQEAFQKTIVDKYAAFYLPKRKKSGLPSAAGATKPLRIAFDVINKNGHKMTNDELIIAISGQINNLMAQVHMSSNAEGFWLLKGQTEKQAIREFAEYMVVEVYDKMFRRDVANLVDQQKLIEHSCEFIIAHAVYKFSKEKQQQND